VTEIRVYNDKGAQLSSYLIGLAAKDGVFALSLSPAKKDIDPLVKNWSARLSLCLERWMLKKRSGCHRRPRRSVEQQ
jgi:hypothetical protein